MDGVSHSVEVTAATLYEAVARGLTAIRATNGLLGISQGLNVVRVSVADVRVMHEVRLTDFTKWLERAGGSPREASEAQDSGDSRDAGCTMRGGLVPTNCGHCTRDEIRTEHYCNFAYSALACFRMGMSGSASFQSERKS
jgi:hypothetical protein